MSEIKGQLLGIILVLAIFGAVAGLLMTAFQQTATDVSSKMNVDTIETNAGIKSQAHQPLTFEK